MGEKRNYTEGVKAALHITSGGGCYRPNCNQPAVRFWDGIPEKNLDIAHIHGFDRNGPRFREMPISKRNAFSNLILLCKPCHKRVDGDEEKYTVKVLQQWKVERERKPLGSLAGLQDLDKTEMEAMLDKAMKEIRHEMASFVEQFPELSGMLRQIVESPPVLDRETVEVLYLAADKLNLPEYAEMLYYAANKLNLPEYAEVMAHAADRLKLPNYAEMLEQAAHSLDLPAQTSQLYAAAERLRLAEYVPQIGDAAQKLTEAVDRISVNPAAAKPSYAPHTLRTNQVTFAEIPSLYWKVLLSGWAGFALCVIIIYFLAKGRS